MSWWTDNAPPDQTQSLHDAVAQIYQTALGRAASEQEINRTIQGGSGDLASIQRSIYASPEAIAYGKSQTAKGDAPTTGASSTTPTGDALQWFMQAINGGMKPQDAIDALNNAGGDYAGLKAAYYPGNNTIGLANGTYLVANPQGVWGPVTRSPEGGSGGGGITPTTLPTTPYGGFGSTPSPYIAPTWTGGPAPTAPNLIPFTAPTEAQLEASPGYASRLAAQNQAITTSAGANGSLLNGGTLKELAKYGQDYASNEYSNLFGQDLATNQNNNNVLQGNFGNAFQSYQQNYGNFMNAANMGFNAYQSNVNNTRNANSDYWSQLNSLYNTGANLAGSSYKPSNVP